MLFRSELLAMVERDRVNNAIIVGDAFARPIADALDAAVRKGRPYDTSSLQRMASSGVMWTQEVKMRLIEHIDAALDFGEQYVPFVSGGPEHPRLEIAPLDVGPVLRTGIWDQRTAILTSATIPSSLGQRVGLAADQFDQIDVGSPFDYEHHALLYCAMHLPDPRKPEFPAAVHDELVELITAAGGRTLALFTSWKAMDAAAEAVRGRIPFTVLTQRDMPKPALVKAFSDDENSCLFATSGFFQGVDIPGRTLSLVVIDRIPDRKSTRLNSSH